MPEFSIINPSRNSGLLTTKSSPLPVVGDSVKQLFKTPLPMDQVNEEGLLDSDEELTNGNIIINNGET